MKKVVGVELCKEAVADAKANADLNGKEEKIQQKCPTEYGNLW